MDRRVQFPVPTVSTHTPLSGSLQKARRNVQDRLGFSTPRLHVPPTDFRCPKRMAPEISSCQVPRELQEVPPLPCRSGPSPSDLIDLDHLLAFAHSLLPSVASPDSASQVGASLQAPTAQLPMGQPACLQLVEAAQFPSQSAPVEAAQFPPLPQKSPLLTRARLSQSHLRLP